MDHRRASGRSLDGQIAQLAVPAFLALVSEPLFLLADAAIVGHLGTIPLAGLAIASVVVQTAVGLCVFLAYGTTAAVARRVGAGDPRGALADGLQGLWLAAALGALLAVLGLASSGVLVDAFGVGPEVSEQAVAYLRPAWLGVAPMLVVLAATGVLRGLADTRTPLVVAVGANAANIGLNLLLVFGAGPVPGLGIAGSAWGTDLAQLGSAVALTAVVLRHARRYDAPRRPHGPAVRRAARAGGPLFLRTLTLRASLVVTTWSAAGLGATAVATHQLAGTIWTFLAYALDAVAIAAQTLTGAALGAGDAEAARALTRRMVRLGVLSGVVTGLALALVAPLAGGLFTDDPAVAHQLSRVLLVAALFQPVAGVVFVLDGVLIGAGDGRYLAAGGAVVLAAFAPLALLSTHLGEPTGTEGLVRLWLAFGAGFIGLRAVVLLHRARGTRWMRLGAPLGSAS